KQIESILGSAGSKGFRKIDQESREVARNIQGYFKDVSRVVSGIIVSQAFYTMTRQLREAASAAWEFHQALQMSAVAFETFMGGDTDRALGFQKALEEF